MHQIRDEDAVAWHDVGDCFCLSETSQIVNTVAQKKSTRKFMPIESELVPKDHRQSRRETHLIGRDETDRTTANHSVFAIECHARQDPEFAVPWMHQCRVSCPGRVAGRSRRLGLEGWKTGNGRGCVVS